MGRYRIHLWSVELALWLAIVGFAATRVVAFTALRVLEVVAPLACRLAQRVNDLSAQVDQLMDATPQDASATAPSNSARVIDGEAVTVRVIWKDVA